jgi:GNAT superfamily N-acetyltransferase
MTKSHTIRLAGQDDSPELIAMINEAFAIEEFLEGTRTDEVRLQDMMGTGKFLLAEDDHHRVMASVYVELRGSRGYLGMLAVSRKHQGKGLGRIMVGAAEKYCREQGCTAMDLTVLSLRPDLPPFYRKLGYAEVRTEDFIPSRRLKDGMQCHAIVMSKQFQGA